MAKDTQFSFRVETPLREQFIHVCKGMDRPAGQVLRDFMREFVSQNGQRSLFDGVPVASRRSRAETGAAQ